MSRGGKRGSRQVTPGRGGRRLRTALLALALLAVSLAAFWPATGQPFVDYDDTTYVTRNTWVARGLGWDTARRAFTTIEGSNWHPVTWLSHLADVSLWGMDAGRHHLTSLLIHAANAVLLFLLLRGLGAAGGVAWFLAALFAVHPLRVESVAWVSERKDVLSGFFFVLTLLAWMKYVRSEIRGHDPNSGTSEMGIVSPRTVSNARAVESSKSQGHDPEFHESSQGHDPDLRSQIGSCPGIPHRVMSRSFTPDGHAARMFRLNGWYVLSLVLFALGLMSKPMLVTLPAVLLLFDWWPLGRLGAPKRAAVLVLEKLPFLLLSAASAVVTMIAQGRGGAMSSLEAVPAGVRAANALTAVTAYIGKILWPSNLSVFYPLQAAIPTWRWVASAFLLAGITTLAILARRRLPVLLVGWLWFLGMLVPVLGLVQVGMQGMADRYTYLPSIGLAAAMTGAVLALLGRRAGRRAWGTAAALAVLALLMVLSRRQTAVWRDTKVLFDHALAVTDKNYLAEGNVGYLLAEQGRLEEALKHYRAALAIKPDDVKTHNNMGVALAQTGRMEEAVEHWRIAARLKPSFPDPLNNLGIGLAWAGKTDEAAASFREALERKPDYAEAHNNLGNLAHRAGRLEEAVAAYRAAIAADPFLVEAWTNLGKALLQVGRAGEAAEALEGALERDPSSAKAHATLAVALERLGRSAEARRHREKAASLGAARGGQRAYDIPR